MKWLVFAGISALLAGCLPHREEADLTKTMVCSAAIRNKTPPESAMDIRIREAWRDGDVIRVKISHGGGCDPDHRFALYQTAEESCIVQSRIVFTTNNPCKRLDESTVCFDVSTLLVAGKGCGDKLRIQGFDKDISLIR